jgi:hypothetical protein
MNPLATSAIVLAFLVAGASFGFLLRAVLPPHHLSEQSKDTIKLAVGLVVTMVALILGLLVASAKSFPRHTIGRTDANGRTSGPARSHSGVLWAGYEESAGSTVLRHTAHSRTTMVTNSFERIFAGSGIG